MSGTGAPPPPRGTTLQQILSGVRFMTAEEKYAEAITRIEAALERLELVARALAARPDKDRR